MAVKKLSSNIQSLFNSSVHLFSYKIAIEELVYNALDAQATSIAIRIHIQENKLQVIDNGCGIAKEDFELLGQKYATSKFDDLTRYKSAPNSYGFRGQSLASLVEVSKYIKITARMTNTENTWAKTFSKGKGKEPIQTTTRPSKGTTVEVNGFLYNLNIQNKGIKPVNELNDIKTLLEQLSFVHNNVSFSLRDDSRNEIIFKTHKNANIYQTMKSLFDIEKSDIEELQVEKNEYKILAYIAKNNDHPDRHHWIFLNKKFVNNTKLQKLIHDNLAKTLNPSRRMTTVKISKNGNHVEDHKPSKNHTSFYFILITCPYFDYDISNTPRQSTLEFKNWNLITKLVEKLVKFYKGELILRDIKKSDKAATKHMLKEVNEGHDTRKQVREIMKKILGSNPKKVGVSQMQNGIKGKLIKRKKKKTQKFTLLNEVPSKEPMKKDKKAPKLTLSKVVPPKEPATNKCKNLSNYIIEDQGKFDDRPNKKSMKANLSHKPTKKHKIYDKNKDTTILRSNKVFNAQNPKLLTSVTKKTKKKSKKDPLLKIFRKQPDLVVERCNLLAREVDNLIPSNNIREQRVFINETVNYSNIIKDNKKISIQKRVGEIIIHDYSPLKPKEKLQHHNLKDIKKEYLKTSYDLLQTIIGTTSINIQNSIPPKKSNGIRERGPQTNKTFLPQLTYQSHNYFNNENLSHNYERNKNMTEAHKKNVYCNKGGNLVTQPFNNFSNVINDPASPIKKSKLINKFKENMKSRNGQTFRKSKLGTKQFNIRSFSDNNTSHTIEFTESKEHKECFYRNNDSEINADRTYEIPITNVQTQCTVTSAFGFTYTIRSSNKTSESRHNLKANSEYCHNDWTSRLIYCTTEEFYANKTIFPQTDQMNVIFISNSSDPNTEKSNDEIEPLNVCETILNSGYELETESIMNSNQNQLNGSLFNLTLRELSSDVRNSNMIRGTQQLEQPSTNQPKSVKRVIKHFENQEITQTRSVIENTLESIDVNQIIETNNEEKAKFNAEELEETERVIVTNDFDIRNRLRFLPKGMSPIFENRCWKNKNIANIESGYFADDLYNKFRDEVYTHAEVYEANFQNPKDFVSKNLVNNNRLDNSLTFNAESLKEANVLGQIDNKFIASILKGKSDRSEFLVLFDQHAVHERIRLEDNLADYFNNNEWRIAQLDDVLLKLSKDEIIYLHNYKDKFTQFGLDWTILDNLITLHGIPAAILGKNPRQVEKVISAVKNLISEVINMIRSQKGCVSLYPKSIMDLVFSEACRYALKFGDKLPHSRCVELIQALTTCKTPFQCAHGRPVMAVIMDIKPETRNYRINMGKIRQMHTQCPFKNKREKAPY